MFVLIALVWFYALAIIVLAGAVVNELRFERAQGGQRGGAINPAEADPGSTSVPSEMTIRPAFTSAGAAVLGCLLLAPAAFAAGGESTPLNLVPARTPRPPAQRAPGGGGIVRTIVGLAVVIGVIYGLHWVLKQVKASKRGARLRHRPRAARHAAARHQPLALQLVRAGREVVLVGVGEAGVTPIRTYTEDEARDARPRRRRDDGRAARPAASRARPTPRAARRLRSRAARRDGAPVKTDGSNAVQLLLLVGGISLVPALLFTVTGFTRILIVLGFIRTGLGTPTAPPNQVLVGIAFFLTLFVMAPTLTKIKHDAYDPLQAREDHADRALKRAEEPMREFMFKQTRDEGPRAVRQAREDRPAQDARRHPDDGPDPGLHHLRAQDGVPDRLPDLPAVPGDRPRRRLDADVDGHGDAAACLHLAAVQDPAVRPRRRLGPRHPVARGVVPHMTQDTVVVSIVVQAMSVGAEGRPADPARRASSSACSSRSSRPSRRSRSRRSRSSRRSSALVAVIVVGGPWMLGQLLELDDAAVELDPVAGRRG